ncbi:S8 family serine peptidase [Brevibacillus ginsengisoli]|uniref:S8 family serine peptidase n=1 Tax=Brevibacillus ginsengisoli TaxID=363854 RepID=UPI003CEA561D
MNKTAKRAIFTAFALSLTVGSLPVFAKPDMSTKEAGSLSIEAEQGLSLRSAGLVKKLSQFDSSSKLVIIQLEGPVEEEWKEQMEDMGVELGDYIPDFAFIARLHNQNDRKKLTKLSFVKRVTPFQPAYKLSPELAKNIGSKKQQKLAVIGFDSDEDATRLVKRIAPKAENIERTNVKHMATLSASGNDVSKLIESDDVIAVVPVGERHYSNDVAAGIIHSDTLKSTGYTGKNQIVGVADSGLDTGNIHNIHPDFVGRIKNLIAVGREDNNDSSDPDGHGTHVAGSIVGTGKASNGKITGMAPDAMLVFHAMDDENQNLQGDLYEMWDEAYQQGARIHSDSWGASDYGAYDYSSYEADKFLWEHKDMTALIAAGNDGKSGDETVGSPATAKNVISVGASENNRPEWSTLPEWSKLPMWRTIADNPDEIAWFSSRGPTIDGRIKPDIVAPGTAILSTRSSLAPDKSFDLNFNSYYAFMSGTSMATPVLAGGTAQVRQYLQENGVNDPSSALIKSMLLTGADDLGLYLKDQGFGRANLVNAIHTTFVDETKGLQTKGTASYSVDVSDSGKPFALTLSWTDYPSSVITGRALVNDLNLVVTAPNGKVYNGNDFIGPSTSDQVDNLNNVEQVYVKNPIKGKWTVKVIGYNVPKGPQPYAIATNGKLANAASPGVKMETKKGTVTATTESDNPSYIDYTISIKKKGPFKATLNWEGDGELSVSLKNRRGKDLVKSVPSDKPETIEFNVTTMATYIIRVSADKGTGNFTLTYSYPNK